MTPDTNPDRFLLAYFAEQERRSSAPGLSMEPRSDPGPERAQHRDAAWIWRNVVVGALEKRGALKPDTMRVLRAYYLRLSATHVALVRLRAPGETHARVVERVHLAQGQTPPPGAEVEASVSWREIGRDLGIHYERCQRLFRRGRGEVAEELRRRADCPAAPDD